MKESDVGKLPCAVSDSQGEVVGFIEAPEAGPLRVKLNPPWDWIAEAINKDVQNGKHMIGPDRTFRVITGTSYAELQAVVHAIRILSERQLQVAQFALVTHTG